jgi:hypothetical protein
MEEETRGARIESPKHRFMHNSESTRLEKVFHIAMDILF